jgi:protein tyrosine phosphatase (PTP) superfamily phosphohydrolase (DUF442 family)
MTHPTLLHTAHVHCATFDALSPDRDLTHMVRVDWLERAQTGIDETLRQEITAAVQAADGPVLCTCTTLGETAEAAGALRIDAPMMAEAARLGGPVLMAYCLDSTRAASLDLLRRAFGDTDPQEQLLDLSAHWPLFIEGKIEEFTHAIAADIHAALRTGTFGCVVIAQASMAGASIPLRSLTEVPILTSPDLALRALLERAAV